VQQGDRRTRLREIALDLFGRQGVQRTSTREILKAAGLRNPSAISYHFGSKAGLVEDIVADLHRDDWPLLQMQVDLASTETPSVHAWCEVAADSAAKLVSTERGCLLARILWEYDCVIAPDAFETFLGSGDPLAVAWQEAIGVTFPAFPRVVAIARNFLVIHTMQWLLSRYAGRVLCEGSGPALKVKYPEDMREALLELSTTLLASGSEFTNETMVFE
jgi:AcrR family transcriptional regulator